MTTLPSTIMVVDDEAAVRSTIGALLDLEGYTVVEASDGDEAIRQIRTRLVDAVVSDVRMPGVDGISLAGWIANNAPGIALMLMSGSRRSVSLRGLPSEALFFQKPFQMPALLAALKNRLARKPQRVQWRNHLEAGGRAAMPAAPPETAVDTPPGP